MINKNDDGVLEEEEKTKSLLSKAEISILLDNYDDIFSDFDPRPFAFRALSDDFLIEAKKAARDKEGTFDLSFLIPKDQRNFEHEVLIKRRLREHFRKHALLIEHEVIDIQRNGIFLIILGFLLLGAAALTTYFSNHTTLFLDLLLVILEPSGWFLFWIGGDKFIYEKRNKLPELEFYHKMMRCEITFHTY